MNVSKVGLMLRLPQEIKLWLAENAKQHSRSMNSQVIEILKEIKRKEVKNVQH